MNGVIKCQVNSLQWRNNERHGVSNHQPHECLLNRLFKRKSKKTSKLRVTGLCEGNSPVNGEFPAQRASYAINVSILWRHHLFKPVACNTKKYYAIGRNYIFFPITFYKMYCFMDRFWFCSEILQQTLSLQLCLSNNIYKIYFCFNFKTVSVHVTKVGVYLLWLFISIFTKVDYKKSTFKKRRPIKPLVTYQISIRKSCNWFGSIYIYIYIY